MATAIKMAAGSDPAKEIRERVGDLSQVTLLWNQVLLGTYVRPRKTAGGIELPDQALDEDIWQGKIALVLALGTRAFKDGSDLTFSEEERIKVGDWVFFRPGDSYRFVINKAECRIISDVSIKAKVASPDIVW